MLHLHDVKSTVKDTSVPVLRRQGVLSQPATVTDRTLPCIEPQSLMRIAFELMSRLASINTDIKDAIVTTMRCTEQKECLLDSSERSEK